MRRTSMTMNSSWMIGEQVVRQVIALLLNIWVARSLGVEAMGDLSFVLALHSVFALASTIGLNRIMVRELAKASGDHEKADLLLAALFMRLSASSVLWVVAVVTVLLIHPQSGGLAAIIALGFFFSAFDIADLFFQSSLQSHLVAKYRLSAFLLSSIVKALLLLLGASLTTIAFAYLLDWVAVAMAMVVLFRRRGIRLQAFRPRIDLCMLLWRESRIELVAGFCGMAFIKLDQIMLQALADTASVANMAISARLSEAWLFVPAAVVASAFPVIVASGDDVERADALLRQLYRRCLLMGTAVAIVLAYLSEEIIVTLYGVEYRQAADLLSVQAWSGLFVAMGLVSGAALMSRNLGHLNLRRNVAGLTFNATLNAILIPRFGAYGAAWASLTAYGFAYFVYDFIDPSMRRYGHDKLRALWPDRPRR